MSNSYGDIVFLRGLAIETTIGFFEWERHVKQTVVVDLEVPDCEVAGQHRAEHVGVDGETAVAEQVVGAAVDGGDAAKDGMASARFGLEAHPVVDPVADERDGAVVQGGDQQVV